MKPLLVLNSAENEINTAPESFKQEKSQHFYKQDKFYAQLS